MDTTETYIKMCDCPEIQGGHHYQTGDRFTGENTSWTIGDATFVYKRDKLNHFERRDRPVKGRAEGVVSDESSILGSLIWLPRQDQLQEMVGRITGLQSLTWLIHMFSESEYGAGFTVSGTMEQLWLAFVMQEKHKKVWDGEKWT